jgi:hypothetical protein
MLGMKKRTWVVGAIIAALLGTGALAARWHEHSPEERAELMISRISQKLELNDQQRAELEKVANAYVDIRGAAPEFMMELSGELQELAAEETLTVEEVNTLRDQIRDEFERRADIMIPQFVSFYNTLDTGQKRMVSARLGHISERMENKGREQHGAGHGWRHGEGKYWHVMGHGAGWQNGMDDDADGDSR